MLQLEQLLSYRRGHETDSEARAINRFIIPAHPSVELMGPMENIIIRTDTSSKTLFSCHTDSVHSKDGRQGFIHDKNLGIIYKDEKSKHDRECLGADDGAGIWLLLQMIRKNIPGTYIFHRGEERGGIGSSWMKANKQDWLKQFKRAIAFDRRGNSDIITTQGGVVCCSDDFAKDLAARLGMTHTPAPRGSFTDTKNYIALIPECTNVSIGYDNEHRVAETLDTLYLQLLRDKCFEVNWEDLVTVREAKEDTGYHYGGMWKGQQNQSWNTGKGYTDLDPHREASTWQSNPDVIKKTVLEWFKMDKTDLRRTIINVPYTAETVMTYLFDFAYDNGMFDEELSHLFKKNLTDIQREIEDEDDTDLLKEMTVPLNGNVIDQRSNVTALADNAFRSTTKKNQQVNDLDLREDSGDNNIYQFCPPSG